MRGNTWGRFLTVTTFGESHGVALGAIIDGCPPGLLLCVEDFARDLARRRPGGDVLGSCRHEPDQPELLSGVFQGRTLGTPIAVIVRNTDTRSSDYQPNTMRTGHADAVWQQKFGVRDWRGGGRSSGRETLARVIGGSVARKILGDGVQIIGFTKQIGSNKMDFAASTLCRDDIEGSLVRCPDQQVSETMVEDLTNCRLIGDSRGGIAEVWVDGLPVGWGEPVFFKLKACLAQAVLSIGGVCGFEVGDGFGSIHLPGQQYHQASHHYGGVLGGLSTGDRLVVRAAFKPTSTLGDAAIGGRHDPCIVPRAIPVLEAMVALVLADFMLEQRLVETQPD